VAWLRVQRVGSRGKTKWGERVGEAGRTGPLGRKKKTLTKTRQGEEGERKTKVKERKKKLDHVCSNLERYTPRSGFKKKKKEWGGGGGVGFFVGGGEGTISSRL